MATPRSLLLSLFCAACATGTPEWSAYPDLQIAFGELKEEQRRFAASNVLPQVFEFPGQGRVTVREVSLDGYPGNTYVRCRWHYRNTTGKPVVRAFVSLDVLDAEGRMVASQVCVAIFPTIEPILNGSYYADELRTKTHDAHLQPGWSWRITCRAEFYTETDDVPAAGR